MANLHLAEQKEQKPPASEKGARKKHRWKSTRGAQTEVLGSITRGEPRYSAQRKSGTAGRQKRLR